MLVTSQIKFWVFGFAGAIGIYLTLTGWGTPPLQALGLTLVAAMVGAFALGSIWDHVKDSEKAATYKREARDERAKQELQEVRAANAKNLIEGPKAPQVRSEEERQNG